MALIEHLQRGTRVRFDRSGLVGRSRECSLHLGSAWTSGQHAAVRWTGEGWELRNLGSRNGTFVDGVRLGPGQKAELQEGLRVAFGQASDAWIVRDVAAPPPIARSALGERRGEDGTLLLPDERQPLVCVLADGGGWRLEAPDHDGPVSDGQEIDVDGVRWRLDLPAALAPTREGGPSLAESALELRVSRDEEHIELHVRSGPNTRVLPHRAHSYLVLTLARARAEADPSLPASEQGWIYQDDLARRLGLHGTHFNVALHRAREQLRLAGYPDADLLIERRRGAGQIRLGLAAVTVGQL